MRIIIAGLGEVGMHLAQMLAQNRHDIVAIDPHAENLARLSEVSDVITIQGSSISLDTLEQAEIDRSDLFVAVASLEETNITASLLAKRLGAKRVIARIDNNEYLRPENQQYFQSLGIDTLIYPEKLASQVIIGLLGAGGTLEYMGFGDGSLALSSFRISQGLWMAGQSLEEIDNHYPTIDFRIIAITRRGDTIIPRGDTLLYDQDTVHVLSTPRGIEQWRRMVGETRFSIENLIVVGASRMGLRTCLDLEHSVKNIKLIERDRAKSEHAASLCTHTLVINGDGRDTDLLIREGLEYADAFVAVTGNSETNILTCMAARRSGVKQIIAEVENIDYIALAESIGVDSVVNKKQIAAAQIFRYTMGRHMASIRYLTGTDAEVAEFIVKEGAPATRGRLKDLHFPPNALVGGIMRGQGSFIAVGDSQIVPGDRVVVFSLGSSMDRLERLFG